ncbi:MAG: hypothetical protein ACLP9K_04305 [Nitrososphaerales archaeon]
MRVELHFVLDRKKKPRFSRKAMHKWQSGQWPERGVDDWTKYWKKQAATLAKNGWKLKGVWMLKH